MHTHRFSMLAAALLAVFLGAKAQSEFRHAITPQLLLGGAFGVDMSNPSSSASLRFVVQMGRASDLFNLQLGMGYRGLFDTEPPREFVEHPSFSDYLLYADHEYRRDEIRPMGGQIIFPVEAHLQLVRLGSSTFLFAGCGAEYGLRLYQSHRYGRYYGAHVMNPTSLAYCPMVGVASDADDGAVTVSLYMRRYMHNCFNDSQLDIGKFTHRNYFGLQLTVAF